MFEVLGFETRPRANPESLKSEEIEQGEKVPEPGKSDKLSWTAEVRMAGGAWDGRTGRAGQVVGRSLTSWVGEGPAVGHARLT